MSAQKSSARRTKPVSAAGAFVGFIGFSALAGLLVTIGVTPAIAVAGVTTTSTIGVFESLPEYIELGELPQRNEVLAYQGGEPVHLATVYDQNRQELKYDQISDNLKNAAIDGEDKRFWNHGGVDMTSLVRAGVGSIAGGLGESGGGSTLTMQLVRNIKMQQALELPTQEARTAAYNDAVRQTIPRKLEEMKLAIGLAKKYSKKDILTGYLNIAFFGDQTYGVQAAAQRYFNKSASDLTPAEAASILAIVQSPNTRNLSDPKYYDANVGRRDVILKSMYAQKHIDKQQLDEALASKPADYVHLTDPTQGCKAAAGTGSQFFCDYAVQVVKEMSQLGSTQKARDAAWRNGGYTIQTTLHLDLNDQQKALIDSYAPNSEARFKLGGVINSVEADTGRILTMAQNKNYNQLQACGTEGADPNACAPTTDSGINLSVDKKYGGGQGFQTGSTFKPFTLLNWLQKGHGLGEIVSGTPHAFSSYTLCGNTTGIDPFTAKNDSLGEGGNMTVESATYRSVNVAYLNMAQKLDYCDIRNTAESLGVHLGAPRKSIAGYGDDMSKKTTSDIALNLSAVLGDNYIAPLTMAAAYAGIANNGTFCRPIAIDNITNAEGKSLGGQQKDCTQAIDPDVAKAAISALKKTLTIGTAANARTPDGFDEFGKTGTTNEADQIWLVGSSTKVATATWLGNIEGAQSLRHVYGPQGLYSLTRTSLWRQAQSIVNSQYAGGQFEAPSSTAVRGNSIAVPNVVGQTPDQARAAIAGAGLTYVDGGVQAGGGTAGTVSSTSPGASAPLSRGSSVTVYTTDGSQSTVPEIGGKSIADAAATLAGAGFSNIRISGQYQRGDGDNQCTVAAVAPGAGSVASKDTAVQLSVYGDQAGKAPKDGCR